MGLYLQVQITRSANQFALRVIWTCKKSLQRQIMVGESNQNVFLIQIDTSKFTEFDIPVPDIEIQLFIKFTLLLKFHTTNYLLFQVRSGVRWLTQH